MGDGAQGNGDRGGCFRNFSAIGLQGKKRNLPKFVVALGGRCHTKKLNSRRADGKGLGEVARPAGNAGERYLIVLGAVELGRGRELNIIDALIKLIFFLASLSI